MYINLYSLIYIAKLNTVKIKKRPGIKINRYTLYKRISTPPPSAMCFPEIRTVIQCIFGPCRSLREELTATSEVKSLQKLAFTAALPSIAAYYKVPLVELINKEGEFYTDYFSDLSKDVFVNFQALVLKKLPKEDRILCLIYINGWVLDRVPDNLKTPAMCLAAVLQNEVALGFVPEGIKTEEMCLAAVRQNGRTLEDVPKHLQTEAVCLAAIRQDGRALEDVPKHLQTEAMCLAAVRQKRYVLQLVSEGKRTEEMRPASNN